MKQNTKFGLLLLGASVLGSATTLLASSALSGNDKITSNSQTVAETSCQQDNNFIRTAGRMPAIESDFTKAAESTINSVVSIKSYAAPRRQQSSRSFDPFEFFFGPNSGFGSTPPRQQQRPESSEQEMQPLGLGSGVIISSDGYIVTNNHVIDGAEKLEVTLNDNSKYNARIIGTDPSTDLALLKVEAENLQAIVFGDSDALKVGEWVLAVGNPFGFTSTVTAGIVSAKARSVTVDGGNRNRQTVDIESFIQTDVAVNQGNSGGALVNTDGQLVGINSMIYSQTGSYAGISFAIPVSVVSKIVNDIKEFGSVQKAVLGISYQELDADKAKEHNITATKEGIYVATVSERSAAMEAGIKEGDVIVKVNNIPVKNSGQMKEQMSKLRPGDKVTLSYYRDNKLQTTTATLKNNQGTTKVTKTNDFMSLGCAFKALSETKKKELALNAGVEVAGIKAGKLKDAGIKDGFIIVEINDTRVASVDDVEAIYNSIMRSADSDKVMFVTGIYPTGKRAYYAVDLSE